MFALIATVGSFIPGLFGKQISFKLAKVLGVAILLVMAVLFFVTAKAIYDHNVISDHEQAREAKASEAREDAADQRAVDTVNNAKSEEELHDVVNAAPGGTLSPAARALGCERLRRLGRIPAACRDTGGDGAEADPR